MKSLNLFILTLVSMSSVFGLDAKGGGHYIYLNFSESNDRPNSINVDYDCLEQQSSTMGMPDFCTARLAENPVLEVQTPMSMGQVIWTEPAFPTQFDDVTVYFDASEGNAALF